MRDVVFKGTSFSDFNEWRYINKVIYNKIVELIEETRRTPIEGKGKPEPLKHHFKGCWSRRISDEHRLIYKFNNETVEIISCKFHYK